MMLCCCCLSRDTLLLAVVTKGGVGGWRDSFAFVEEPKFREREGYGRFIHNYPAR